MGGSGSKDKKETVDRFTTRTCKNISVTFYQAERKQPNQPEKKTLNERAAINMKNWGVRTKVDIEKIKTLAAALKNTAPKATKIRASHQTRINYNPMAIQRTPTRPTRPAASSSWKPDTQRNQQ